MQIEVCQVKEQVTDALRELSQQQVERALGPYAENVERVEVRIQNVDGARGETETQCRVTAEIVASSRKVVVESTRSKTDEAVRTACGRLGASMSRVLTPPPVDGASGAPPPAVRAAVKPPPVAVAPQGSAAAQPAAPRTRIQVTTEDYERLQKLIELWSGARDSEAADALAEELDRADVVSEDQIAGNVVTMNSRVLFEDQQTGETREVSLVYPQDSDVEKGCVSILAPVGTALLGLSVGQTIDWPLPGGHVKQLRIVKVTDQSSGARHLRSIS